MDPFTLSMLAAGVGSSAFSWWSNHRANKANRHLSREQMSFQERMSNTAYQRQMADMRSAGLNPMYSANAGGASSPSGSTAQMVSEMPQGGSALEFARA